MSLPDSYIFVTSCLGIVSEGKLQERHRWGIPAVLLAFSFCLLLLAGGDGWFRIETFRSDSAWFMMAGKSWMAGLTPYVDFSDSKGPLLWLIYGLGHLISPHNFHGVFFFEVLAFWASFYFLFRIALIFLHDQGKSLLASFLMGFLYFYPALHQEMRAEDFCHVFQSYTMLVLIRVLYLNKAKRIYFLGIGLCLGAVLLIKFSYFLTLSVPTLFLVGYSWVNFSRKISGIYSLYILAGMAAVILPFLVYFLIIGNLQAFINEYFLSTGQTILNSWKFDEASGKLKDRWPFVLLYYHRMDHYFAEFMRIILVGLLMTLYLVRRKKILMMAIAAWYLLSILLFALKRTEFYYIVNGIFAFGGIILVLRYFESVQLPFAVFSGGLVLAVLTILTTHYIYSEFHYPRRDLLALQTRGQVETIINRAEKELGRRPTLVYYRTWEKGEHIGTNAVAGIKYWAYQTGMTAEMDRQHETDILLKRPDFIITAATQQEAIDRFKLSGYEERMIYVPRPTGEGEEEAYVLLADAVGEDASIDG